MNTSKSTVLPGQPIYIPTAGTPESLPGSGAFTRGGQIFASRIGQIAREGGKISVSGKEIINAIPDVNNLVCLHLSVDMTEASDNR